MLRYQKGLTFEERCIIREYIREQKIHKLNKNDFYLDNLDKWKEEANKITNKYSFTLREMINRRKEKEFYEIKQKNDELQQKIKNKLIQEEEIKQEQEEKSILHKERSEKRRKTMEENRKLKPTRRSERISKIVNYEKNNMR